MPLIIYVSTMVSRCSKGETHYNKHIQPTTSNRHIILSSPVDKLLSEDFCNVLLVQWYLERYCYQIIRVSLYHNVFT